jgi:ABC-type transport system involved in multi-copper enzyme maturation permease subunit
MPHLQPEIALKALSYGLVVLLGITLLALALISLRKEDRQGQPVNGMIWFTVAIIGSCAVVVLLAGYAQKASSLEKVTHRVEVVTFGLE